MDRSAKVLILAWRHQHLEELEGELCLIPELQIARVLLTTENGLVAVIRSQIQLHRPDFLLYREGEDLQQELRELALLPGPNRPSSQILVTSSTQSDPSLMTLIMQAGFRDLLASDLVHQRLADTFRNLVKERRSTLDVKNRIIAFVSPLGGTGNSAMASALGHALVSKKSQKTILLDLNFQFGTQYLTHGIEPGKGLKEVLDHIETLDVLALRAYVSRTSTGLDVLGVVPSQTLVSDDIDVERVLRLIDLLTGEYDNLILDIPNHIDALYGAVLQRVTQAIIVVRQDLACVRHGAKLLQILEKELDLSLQILSLLVNAYCPEHSISVEDIVRIMNLEVLGIVPWDNNAIAIAGNLGIPLEVHAPRSDVQIAIERIASKISPTDEDPKIAGNLVVRVIRRLRVGL